VTDIEDFHKGEEPEMYIQLFTGHSVET